MSDGQQVRAIFVNGRFLRGPITGTSRVAEEVLKNWDDSIAAGDARFEGYRICVLTPTDAKRKLPLRNIESLAKDVLGGKAWELFDLSVLAWHGTLLNFANISPLYHPSCITYLHDAQVFLEPASYSAKQRLSHRPLSRVAGLISKKVITVSQFSSDTLQRFGVAPAERIVPVHNGADHILRTEPDFSVLEKSGLRQHHYVFMLGSALAYKNTDVIYKAFALLKDKSLKLAVLERSDLRKTLKFPQEVLDRIVTVSNVDDSMLRALYESALVFVQPARTEGFAMTQLEALNSGSPVITTAEGSMPEVLHDSVVYADATSPQAWAEAITRFAEEPDLRGRMLEAGRQVAARYTWKLTADRVWDEVAAVAATRDPVKA
jgi:glycosyltransferase involved in cell wall biosynthesis